MKVIIWGAGKGCYKAIKVCEVLDWEIIYLVDSDSNKHESTRGEYIVKHTNILNNIDEDTWIIIGASSLDILDLAQKYTKLIISWDLLNVIYKGCLNNPCYETKQLEDKNIKNCKVLKNRTSLLKNLSAHYDNKFNFAEIGVAFGNFSREIINICKPEKLYLIDAWEGERFGSGIDTVMQNFEDEIKMELVEIKRGFSFDVLYQFEEESIDIVYIDTDHSYDTTWKELQICSQKVKKNGFICGHDYTKYNTSSRIDYGVYDAVNRFCVEYEYEIIYLTLESNGLNSFALKKIES